MDREERRRFVPWRQFASILPSTDPNFAVARLPFVRQLREILERWQRGLVVGIFPLLDADCELRIGSGRTGTSRIRVLPAVHRRPNAVH